MTIYNLYLFDRDGTLLFYHEWIRTKYTSMSKGEEAKLLYGMLFSLKSFSAKLSPADMKTGFMSYKTSIYRLSLYETASSLKFVVNTDNESSQQEVMLRIMICNIEHLLQIRDLMCSLYSNVYVEFATKSPMSVPGEMVTSNLFRTKVDQFIKSSSLYKNTE